MLIRYKCCFCKKIYDWYDGLYENPNYDSSEESEARRKGEEYKVERGVFVKVNGMVLAFIPPIDDSTTNAVGIKLKTAGGSLDRIINVCPDCMRKMLNNLYCCDERSNAWDSV